MLEHVEVIHIYVRSEEREVTSICSREKYYRYKENAWQKQEIDKPTNSRMDS